MTFDPFNRVDLAPRDPILGVNEAFAADARTTKVNLGVGVYTNEEGKIPLLHAVREAEAALVTAAKPRGYLPIDGIAAYDQAVQRLLFGDDSPLLAGGRLVTAQALGGTGALKIGADFLRRFCPAARVLISDPSWENHRALFESAGFQVDHYPYYDAQSHGLNFAGMSSALTAAASGTIVVLHTCCHNPTGVDPTPAQWRDIAAIVKTRQLLPILDFAYQGFGDGIDADSAVVRLFADSGSAFLVASSFSKSFSLYGERVGALTVVTASGEESARVLSQVKRVIRTNYSNPPTHGSAVVAAVLNDRALRARWDDELGEMRERIKSMRRALVEGLRARKLGTDFSFVLSQRGMFSYSGLTAAQVERLQKEFGIYALSTGRICVAALNTGNINYVCDAIATVVRS